MVCRVDHVIHDPPSPLLAVNWIGNGFLEAKLLLEAIGNELRADRAIHAEQLVPIGAAAPAINLSLGF
jgi:hypothetical protein